MGGWGPRRGLLKRAAGVGQTAASPNREAHTSYASLRAHELRHPGDAQPCNLGMRRAGGGRLVITEIHDSSFQ